MAMKQVLDRTESGHFWCAPTVIAVATGVPYSEVEARIKARWIRNNPNSRQAKGQVKGVSASITEAVLKEYGVTSVPVMAPQEWTSQPDGPSWPSSRFVRGTLSKAITRGLFKDGLYRVAIRNHTLLVRDYLVYDNFHKQWTWFGDYWAARSRVKRAWDWSQSLPLPPKMMRHRGLWCLNIC